MRFFWASRNNGNNNMVSIVVSVICKIAVAMLLKPQGGIHWPLAAEWMLRAVERHALPLIPFLARETAESLRRAYAARYKPWDRLPAQKEVYRALRERAAGR